MKAPLALTVVALLTGCAASYDPSAAARRPELDRTRMLIEQMRRDEAPRRMLERMMHCHRAG